MALGRFPADKEEPQERVFIGGQAVGVYNQSYGCLVESLRKHGVDNAVIEAAISETRH